MSFTEKQLQMAAMALDMGVDDLKRKLGMARHELEARLDDLLTYSEASELVNKSVGYLRNLTVQGRLKRHYVCAKPHLSREELLNLSRGSAVGDHASA